MTECTPRRAGVVAPQIDRNRCEAKADCVSVCPYGVFAIQDLQPGDRSALSFRGRIKAWAHGGRQAYVVQPENCHACRLCLSACPENAIALAPWKPPRVISES